MRELEPHPFDRLPANKQRIVTAAFHRRNRRGRIVWEPRDGVSVRAIAAAWRIVRQLDQDAEKAIAAVYPTPPSFRAWMVWRQYQQQKPDGGSFDALAAEGSGLDQYLRGSTMESRKTEAKRFVKKVEQFRRSARPWWWKIVTLEGEIRAGIEAGNLTSASGTN